MGNKQIIFTAPNTAELVDVPTGEPGEFVEKRHRCLAVPLLFFIISLFVLRKIMHTV